MPKLHKKSAPEGQSAETRAEADMDVVMAKLSLFGDLWMTKKDRREVERADKKIDEEHERNMERAAYSALKTAIQRAKASSNAYVIK